MSKKKRVKVRPCPFCGKRPKLTVTRHMLGPDFDIKCKNDKCKITVYGGWCKTLATAVKQWNHRARPQQLIDMNGDLKEDVDC